MRACTIAAAAVNRYPLASSSRARDRSTAELRKQKDGGDEIDDRERGLITGDERRHGRERHAGKRHGACEQDRRNADHGKRRPAIAVRGRHGREKDAAVVCLHYLLPQTGIARAELIASNRITLGAFRQAGYPSDTAIPLASDAVVGRR